MNDNLNFENMTSSEDFKVINHNETDFESFKNFQKNIDQIFSSIEKERSREERIKNVRKWDSMQTARWKGASIKTIKNPAAIEAEAKIKKYKFGSFYIVGAHGVGKTYLAHAILRRYIGLGWITPSQVKIINEESLLRIPQLGFAGRERFEDLMDKQYKIYLLDSVGQRDHYDPKRESPLWDQLIDHIYTQSLSAIFTSVYSAEAFSDILPNTAGFKFRHLVENKEIHMIGNGVIPELKGYTESELQEEKEIVKKHNAEKEQFDLFKK